MGFTSIFYRGAHPKSFSIINGRSIWPRTCVKIVQVVIMATKLRYKEHISRALHFSLPPRLPALRDTRSILASLLPLRLPPLSSLSVFRSQISSIVTCFVTDIVTLLQRSSHSSFSTAYAWPTSVTVPASSLLAPLPLIIRSPTPAPTLPPHNRNGLRHLCNRHPPRS